jgi:DNA-binding NtrC family response regulator
VRVVAATNRDLPLMVAQGLFREDLYYRLATVTLRLPPLRERPGDIDLLARHFVALFNERFGIRKTLAPKTIEHLRRQAWPGNVRELMHAIEAAMVVCDGDEILPSHLTSSARREIAPVGALDTLEAVERAHIERVLQAMEHRRAETAKTLGISERNLYRKLREYGLLGD